jgi:2-polyprenyl-6-methoxyphenol hydroxylase-like FAD-dependent oxidoreductase
VLIGDAAGATHFWPGRGLNRGLSSAYALSKVLSHIDPDRDLRNANFYRFEAVMAALQSRHQDRAWRSMVQTRDGVVTPVSSIIASAMAGTPGDRDALLTTMRERVQNLSACLAGRLPGQPSSDELVAALNSVDDETLAVLVASGPWETRLSGGPEVDVDALLGSREIALADAT